MNYKGKSIKIIPENFFYTYGRFSAFIMLVIIIVLSALVMPYSLEKSSIMNVILQNSSLLIVACGTQLVLISGEVDMSCGATAGLCGCLSAYFMAHTNSLLLALLIGLISGLLIGLINGAIITHFNALSFIVTISMQMIISGITLSITNAQPIYNIGKMSLLGSNYSTFASMPAIIMFVSCIVTLIILNILRFGRLLYATGSNIHAAIACGIHVRLIKTTAFIYQGIMAAIGGIVLMARLNSGQPTGAGEYNIMAITAVVIGGTSIKGGTGNIYGTIAGVFFLGVLTNFLTFVGINANYQQIIQGIFLLVAVIMDTQANTGHKSSNLTY